MVGSLSCGVKGSLEVSETAVEFIVEAFTTAWFFIYARFTASVLTVKSPVIVLELLELITPA